MTKIEIKKAKPTGRHRLAIVPGILGTVYGVNEHGHAKYFRHNVEAAYEYAGVTQERDPRLFLPVSNHRHVLSGAMEAEPVRTRCIWVLRD